MYILIFIILTISFVYLDIKSNSKIKSAENEFNSMEKIFLNQMNHKNKQTELEKYLSEIQYFTLLSHEEENKLAKDIQTGNQNSLEKLVKSHLKNVIKIVLKINSHLHPELIHEGNIGLIEAGRAYKGKITFIKFARPYIIKNIKQFLTDNPSYKQPYVEHPRVRICGTCLMNRRQTV